MPHVWRTVLLVFMNTSASYVGPRGADARAGRLDLAEAQAAVRSYVALPELAERLSGGRVRLTTEVVFVEEPIASVSSVGTGGFWVAPADIRATLAREAPPGRYDSVFVHWSQGPIPSSGWGWGLWSPELGATYATVGDAALSRWREDAPGELFLHEWLHGVSGYLRSRGFEVLHFDADGGGRYGYAREEGLGWTRYYRDFMRGEVWRPAARRYRGIGDAGWAVPTPTMSRSSASSSNSAPAASAVRL